MIPINGALGGWGNPVDQDGRVSLHKEKGKTGDRMAADFALFPPCPPCYCLGNFFHLSHCSTVPSTKRFERQGNKWGTLSLTIISCSSHFSLEGEAKTVPWGDSNSWTVACCNGLTTVTSSAASQPAAQLGRRTSAGRRSLPGRRNRPSLTGLRTALEAILKMWSLISLCLVMRSPQNPQHSAWSPYYRSRSDLTILCFNDRCLLSLQNQQSADGESNT